MWRRGYGGLAAHLFCIDLELQMPHRSSTGVHLRGGEKRNWGHLLFGAER